MTPSGRIQLDESEKRRLESAGIFDGQRLQFLGSRPYTAVEHAGSGFKGVVWKVVDDYGNNFAAKITVPEDYADKSHHTEVYLRQGLVAPLFTRCVDSGLWRPKGFDRDFVVTIEEWVEGGRTLEKLLASSASISTSTICGFVQQVCRALEALDARGLAHDDFHAGNIIIRPAQPGEPQYHEGRDAFQIVVVDTGSLKRKESTKKPITDVMHFAGHVAALHNKLAVRSDLSTTDRRFLHDLRQVIAAMLDDDANRALTVPGQIQQEVDRAYRSSRTPPQRDAALSSPFDYISAEQISSDSLLLRLFAHTSWVDDVLGPNPILLTGPRGCGKSMLFRWLSLRTHTALVDRAVPLDDLNMCGVYISCSSDLQNKFADLSTEAGTRRQGPEIVHYFNLLLSRELIHTLIAAQGHASTSMLFGLDDSSVVRSIADLFAERVATPSSVAFASSPLQQALEGVEDAMYASHRRLRLGEVGDELTDLSTLGDITMRLQRLLPVLERYRLTFLLDDFSSHRISPAIQALLTPVIWERRASHSFKVSSEKAGYRQDHLENLSADPTREFLEVDCGREFLSSSDHVKAQKNRLFATELLNNRLKAAGWASDAEALLGVGPGIGALAVALREKNAGGKPQYYGINTVAHLCSGDVSTLLLVYRTMFDGRKADDTTMISHARQDHAIKQVSRQQLEAIPFQRPLGRDMHTIAAEFGTFVGRTLREGRGMSTPDGFNQPQQVPRIEVDAFGAFLDAGGLGPDQAVLMDELLRRAVFIDVGAGQSRRNKAETLRWHFRRILLPAFMAGLGKNEAVKWHDPSMFRWFLVDPKDALEPQLRQRTEPTPEDRVPDLWDLSGDEEAP